MYFCLPSTISNFTNNKSVVFRWLRNERSGKRFSNTRLGVWVRVCMGSSSHMAFQSCLPLLTVAWLVWHGSQLCVKNELWKPVRITIFAKSTISMQSVSVFFWLAVVSCQGETQFVGDVHNLSSTRVAEFDFLSGNLNSGCLTCAYSLWFSFKRLLYHIVS